MKAAETDSNLTTNPKNITLQNPSKTPSKTKQNPKQNKTKQNITLQNKQLILSKEFLDILDLMIDHREMLIRKRVGWVINNIMNGNSDILEVIIAHNIFRKFLNKLSLDQIDVRAELLSALLGYLSCANND